MSQFNENAARELAKKLGQEYSSDSDVIRCSLMLQAESVINLALEEIAELSAENARLTSEVKCCADIHGYPCELCKEYNCGRDMDRGEPHTAECASALQQDHEHGA